MDYLGFTPKQPSRREDGKWNYVELEYNDSDEFNEATSSIMKILYSKNNDSDGKCTVFDARKNEYALEIVHASFDTMNNIITVLPYSCFTITKEKNERKQTTANTTTVRN